MLSHNRTAYKYIGLSTLCVGMTILLVFGGVTAYAGSGATAGAPSKVSEKEWAVAINLAGRQRMLSQKMTKEFLLVAAKVDEDENKKSCQETATMFADTLDRLLHGDSELNVPAPPTPEINQQLQKVKGLWDEFKVKLTAGIQSGTISPETLNSIAELNVPLLQEMNKAVGIYESESQKAGMKGLGTVVNVAGRQRMLTQKMSKEVLLISLGIAPDANRKALQETKNLFQKSLSGLVQGDAELGLPATTTPLIVAQMKKVELLWNDFSPLVDQVIGNPSVSTDQIKKMAQVNPKLLQEMNKAVTMYEAAAK